MQTPPKTPQGKTPGAETPRANTPQGGKRRRCLAFGFVIAAALGGSAAYLTRSQAGADPGPIQAFPTAAASPQPLTQPPQRADIQPAAQAIPGCSALVARVSPAVVSITTRMTQEASRQALRQEASRRTIEQGGAAQLAAPRPRPARRGMPVPAMEARGSGFIIAANGTIVTNNHVVAGEQSVSVTLDNGTRLPATVIGRDPYNDIALLKIDAGHRLPYVRLADSRAVRPGEWIVAIGNPFGLGGSVTRGIVSAVQRRIAKDGADPFIQVDAPINPGNSGGPLLAMNGEVIGMDTAILSPSGDSAGIGFAIPSNLIRSVVSRLQAEADHHLTGQYLPHYASHSAPAGHRGVGLVLLPLSPDLRSRLGVPHRLAGAVVGEVKPNSLAEIAGLQPGDVIVGVNTKRVRSPLEVEQAVLSGLHGARHAVALRIIRDRQAIFVGIAGGRNGLG